MVMPAAPTEALRPSSQSAAATQSQYLVGYIAGAASDKSRHGEAFTDRRPYCLGAILTVAAASGAFPQSMVLFVLALIAGLSLTEDRLGFLQCAIASVAPRIHRSFHSRCGNTAKYGKHADGATVLRASGIYEERGLPKAWSRPVLEGK